MDSDMTALQSDGIPAFRETLLKEDERFRYVDWGRVEYHASLERMMSLVECRMAGAGKDTIIFVEHPPVITLGRNTRGEDVPLLSPLSPESIAGVPVVSVDRGGGPTLHNPGQLVIYPVIKLKVHEQRLHDLLIAFEMILIRAAADFGVEAFRREGMTGAWTQHGKLASIGIHLKRWVCYHGLALNVVNDLSLFGLIVPCGLQGIQMTGLAEEAGHDIAIRDVASSVIAHFPSVWKEFAGRRIVESP